jgi:hypothetical protein
MKSTSAIILTVALALPACAALQRDEIGDKENNLAAAGFTVRPASNDARMTMLRTLPANRISQRIEGDRVSYLYPDPVVCHCLYVGGQAAYGRYQQMAIQQRIARDQIEAAQLNSDFAWDWGPWGGYGPGFY